VSKRGKYDESGGVWPGVRVGEAADAKEAVLIIDVQPLKSSVSKPPFAIRSADATETPNTRAKPIAREIRAIIPSPHFDHANVHLVPKSTPRTSTATPAGAPQTLILPYRRRYYKRFGPLLRRSFGVFKQSPTTMGIGYHFRRQQRESLPSGSPAYTSAHLSLASREANHIGLSNSRQPVLLRTVWG